MVGVQGIAERTRAKKSSSLANGTMKSPKKVGTQSSAFTSASKGTKKKTSRREADESDTDISVVPSSSPEPESDDGTESLPEEDVEIDDEPEKGKSNGENGRATKKRAIKDNGIEIIEPEGKPGKKKTNDVSGRKSEGKKVDKKKLKRVEEEEIISSIKQRSKSTTQEKKPKGRDVEVKSPEKSREGADFSPESKKEKERTRKRRNKAGNEGKRDDKRQKMNAPEVEQQRNGTNKHRNEGAKKENKQENKKQKKKVAKTEEQRNEAGQRGRRGKKEDKKDKKKNNKEVEIDMEEEEENDKSNSTLYKFPMNRVSRIIKSEDLNNKIAQEAVFVINKAAEKFLEVFCREAYACAFLDRKNHVAYNHLSSVVSKRRRFDFLSDFVPEKVKAEAALAEMTKTETETESET